VIGLGDIGVAGRLLGVTGSLVDSLTASLDDGLMVVVVVVVAVGVEHLSIASSLGRLGGLSTMSESSSLTEANEDSCCDRCKL